MFGQDVRRRAVALIVPAGVFLLVTGIGAAVSITVDPIETASPVDAHSSAEAGSDSEMVASLSDYLRSVGAKGSASAPADGKMLPDVDTMIGRLVARLEAAPGDANGWRMLGWSYSQMERYEQAAAAYAKAIELDPNSAELKRLYDETKANVGSRTASIAMSEATLPHEQVDQIRSMVDSLAARLEKSPRDAEGWTRLMRSRVVLGETEAAATTLRKALEVFKDDFAAASRITAAATELGLKVE
jgi:cytochrome c-type biogenesis protein CcmH